MKKKTTTLSNITIDAAEFHPRKKELAEAENDVDDKRKQRNIVAIVLGSV